MPSPHTPLPVEYPVQLDFPRRIAILGSTGSIGQSTLRVIEALPGRFEVVALAAGRNLELLEAQARRFQPRLVSVADAELAKKLKQCLSNLPRRPEVLHGPGGLRAVAAESPANLIVAAVVGVACLEAALAALQAGKLLALANKELLVAGGPLLAAAAAKRKMPLLPIDSEHSAIHQCLRAGRRSELRRLILTASGGPFRDWPPEKLAKVKPEQALRHPTWQMGQRVTLDSATLMNKGFEILEACHLFGLEEAQVEVLIHPQSLAHSLVEFHDGSVLAQLSPADMAMPIQYALTYPERMPHAPAQLDLAAQGRLEFFTADENRYPCLRLARQAGRTGGTAGAILNAADEVAAAEFMKGRLGFPAIADCIEAVLSQIPARPLKQLEDVLAADAEARQAARDWIVQNHGSRVSGAAAAERRENL